MESISGTFCVQKKEVDLSTACLAMETNFKCCFSGGFEQCVVQSRHHRKKFINHRHILGAIIIGTSDSLKFLCQCGYL